MQDETLRLWLLPTLLFALAVITVELARLDVWLADTLYALEGHEWALRRHVITSDIIHEGGRQASIALALVLAAALVFSKVTNRWRGVRGDVFRVFLTALTCVALVNLLKAITGVSCPWDMTRYGGDEPLQLTWAAITQGGANHCFPAGHASGAYGWFGAWFFARRHLPAWHLVVLAVVISIGLTFGISQQLRGAHFLSHDLWTIWLCWTVAFLMRPRDKPADLHTG